MKSSIWQLIALSVMVISFVCKDIEIRKLKKRLKELEPEIKLKKETYGKCNECGGDMIEWIWNREGFKTARIIIACENHPVCKAVF